MDLQPAILGKPSASAMARGSAYAAEEYQPRQRDAEEKHIAKCLGKDIRTPRTTTLRGYTAIVDDKLANRRIRENPSLHRYFQLGAGFSCGSS